MMLPALQKVYFKLPAGPQVPAASLCGQPKVVCQVIALCAKVPDDQLICKTCPQHALLDTRAAVLVVKMNTHLPAAQVLQQSK